MLIYIFGESCTGKSTLADAISSALGGRVMSGKDYLRLAKSEGEAVAAFKELLAKAVDGEENIIYVAAEPELSALVPAGAIRILVTAELETIKERFAKRMHGNLPAPVASMLEAKHGVFDSDECDIHVHGGVPEADEVVEKIKGIIKSMTGGLVQQEM